MARQLLRVLFALAATIALGYAIVMAGLIVLTTEFSSSSPLLTQAVLLVGNVAMNSGPALLITAGIVVSWRLLRRRWQSDRQMSP